MRHEAVVPSRAETGNEDAALATANGLARMRDGAAKEERRASRGAKDHARWRGHGQPLL